MRFLAVFLLTLLPLLAVLYLVDRDTPPVADLPEAAPPADTPAVLEGADLAGAGGVAPFRGRVLRLADLEFQVVDGEKNYVRYYVRCGRLARHDGRPRLEEFFAALFDPPEGDRPNLRLTLESPHVEGDPAALLAVEGEPQIVRLAGGVTVRDARGRTMMRMASLEVDLQARTLASPDPVVLRDPGSGAEVSALGLFADVEGRQARLETDVVATLPVEGGSITLRCAGPAAVRMLADREAWEITLEGRADVEHPWMSGSCDRIGAVVARTNGEPAPERVRLEGALDMRFDPEIARGLERVQAPAIVLEGQRRLVIEGPFTAVRRAPIEALGLGERTLDLEAGGADITLRSAGGEAPRLEEVLFPDGLRAVDRGGAGSFAAGWLRYVEAEGLLEAGGGVRGDTADAALSADCLQVRARGEEAYDLRLGDGNPGERRVEVVADGRLGPLGKTSRGRLAVSARGPLEMRARGDLMEFSAHDAVTVALGDGARLTCDGLGVRARAGGIEAVTAEGAVGFEERQQEASIRCAALAYEKGIARLEGAPAQVLRADGSRVEARILTYADDGSFGAEQADVLAPLDRGGKTELWRLRCGSVKGVLESKGVPRRLEASGGVLAVGPDGQQASGSTFAYEGDAGRASLRGKPAVLERGSGLRVEAPGFDLLVRDGGVAEGSTLGDTRIDFRPEPDGAGAERQMDAVRYWRIFLAGPAALEGETVAIPGKATVAAHGEKDVRLLDGTAVGTTITLARTPRGLRPGRIAARGGVTVRGHGREPATVTAEQLAYEVGSGLAEVSGDVRVTAAGWPSEVTFARLLFVLGPDGVELKRATGVEVTPKAQR